MGKYSGDQGYQAFRLLQIVFIIAPILAGLDKFFYLMVDWSQYLAPQGNAVLDGYVRAFFVAVGIIEIIAGIGVIFKPKIFGYIVFIWLALITINLVLASYYDIALRDLGLCLSALALARLSHKYQAA